MSTNASLAACRFGSPWWVLEYLVCCISFSCFMLFDKVMGLIQRHVHVYTVQLYHPRSVCSKQDETLPGLFQVSSFVMQTLLFLFQGDTFAFLGSKYVIKLLRLNSKTLKIQRYFPERGNKNFRFNRRLYIRILTYQNKKHSIASPPDLYTWTGWAIPIDSNIPAMVRYP